MRDKLNPIIPMDIKDVPMYSIQVYDLRSMKYPMIMFGMILLDLANVAVGYDT